MRHERLSVLRQPRVQILPAGLANQLGALKNHPYGIKVQEDFQQGGYTLLDKLSDYVRECDLQSRWG
jgi:hypothetical protein